MELFLRFKNLMKYEITLIIAIIRTFFLTLAFTYSWVTYAEEQLFTVSASASELRSIYSKDIKSIRVEGLQVGSNRRALELDEISIFSRDAKILGGESESFRPRSSVPPRVFRGVVADEDNSIAVIVVSREGDINGVVETSDGRSFIIEQDEALDSLVTRFKEDYLPRNNPFQDDVLVAEPPARRPGAVIPEERIEETFLSGAEIRVLPVRIPISGLRGSGSDLALYKIRITGQEKSVAIKTSGGSGDLDLFILSDKPSVESNFLCASQNLGNDELCLIENPEAGEYMVAIAGYDSFQGATLEYATAQGLAAGELYGVTIAIDIDYEMYTFAGGNDAAVDNYFALLFAYMNDRYEAEIVTRLLIGDRVYRRSSDDNPYSGEAGSCSATRDNRISELKSLWTSQPELVAVQRTLVAHFMEYETSCGKAWYLPQPGSALCDATWGYSVTSLTESSPYLDSGDTAVVSHELGHNFGSPHSHCYTDLGGDSNPVDACFASEGNASYTCWSGPEDLPGIGSLTGGVEGTGAGTLMSYCTRLPGGASNRSRTFGLGHDNGIKAYRIPEFMRGNVEYAQAIYPECISVIDTGQTHSISVTRAGTGTGTVTSVPLGIDCGLTCSANFSASTLVRLNALADPDSDFMGWSGASCSGTDPCVVELDAAKSVTAIFDLQPNELIVTKTGKGRGVVADSLQDIDCGQLCTKIYPTEQMVELTATPDSGSIFVGWSGACSGRDICSVTVNARKRVGAFFIPEHLGMYITNGGTCGGGCTEPGMLYSVLPGEGFALDNIASPTGSGLPGLGFDSSGVGWALNGGRWDVEVDPFSTFRFVSFDRMTGSVRSQVEASLEQYNHKFIALDSDVRKATNTLFAVGQDDYSYSVVFEVDLATPTVANEVFRGWLKSGPYGYYFDPVAVDTDGTLLLVANDTDKGRILYRFDPETTDITRITILPGEFSPNGMGIAADGTIYVTDLGGPEPVGELYALDRDNEYTPHLLASYPGFAVHDVAFFSDSDGDGIIDELDEDDDNDGVTDVDELLLGTNPLLADSDGDGLSDGEEVALGTNPLKKDSDGDGYMDGAEVQAGSDPLDSDDIPNIRSSFMRLLPALCRANPDLSHCATN